MTLREQVARRLRAVWRRDVTLDTPLDTGYAAEHWLRAADECLRLMEWSKRELWAAQGLVQTNARAFHAPLTLPPDEWTP